MVKDRRSIAFSVVSSYDELKNLGIKSAGALLSELDISPKKRPEQLEPQRWIAMARWLQSREA